MALELLQAGLPGRASRERARLAPAPRQRHDHLALQPLESEERLALSRRAGEGLLRFLHETGESVATLALARTQLHGAGVHQDVTTGDCCSSSWPIRFAPREVRAISYAAMGAAVRTGLEDVPGDHALAASLYMRAALAGSSWAAFTVGQWFDHSQRDWCAPRRDFERAAHF